MAHAYNPRRLGQEEPEFEAVFKMTKTSVWWETKLSISFLLEALLKPHHIIQESSSVTGWKMALWRGTGTTNHMNVWKVPEGWLPTDPGLDHTQNYFKEPLSFSNVRWLLTDLKRKNASEGKVEEERWVLARVEIVRNKIPLREIISPVYYYDRTDFSLFVLSNAKPEKY